MDLSTTIHERTAAFVEGQLSLAEFRDWIAAVSEQGDEDGSSSDQALCARIWRFISEHGYGHRDDESLSEELTRAITPVALTWDRSRPAEATTGGATRFEGAAVVRRTGYQPGVQLVSTS